MRKIKEVLRLHSLRLTQRQIARSCGIGQSTVAEYLKAAEAAQLGWPEVADWEESRLAAALLPKTPVRPHASRLPEPDFATIHGELQQHKHLTLQLLWQEYRATHPGGYGYSRFCELYQRWRRKREVVLRQEHRAGEITTLRLDDIDWRREQVRVRHSKTDHETLLPLLKPVGEVLLDYFQNGRPKVEAREFFIRVRAPYRPFRSGSSLFAGIVRHLERAGVKWHGKHGPHAFRHYAGCRTIPGPE